MKKVICLAGPSGSGKTYMRQTDKKLKDLPAVDIADVYRETRLRPPRDWKRALRVLLARAREALKASDVLYVTLTVDRGHPLVTGSEVYLVFGKNALEAANFLPEHTHGDCVFLAVAAARDHPEVSQPVISGIPVQVMNVLFAQKSTSQVPSHDEAMFQDITPATNHLLRSLAILRCEEGNEQHDVPTVFYVLPTPLGSLGPMGTVQAEPTNLPGADHAPSVGTNAVFLSAFWAHDDRTRVTIAASCAIIDDNRSTRGNMRTNPDDAAFAGTRITPAGRVSANLDVPVKPAGGTGYPNLGWLARVSVIPVNDSPGPGLVTCVFRHRASLLQSGEVVKSEEVGYEHEVGKVVMEAYFSPGSLARDIVTEWAWHNELKLEWIDLWPTADYKVCRQRVIDSDIEVRERLFVLDRVFGRR